MTSSINPIVLASLRANVPPAAAQVRVALYNAATAGRIKTKDQAQLVVKALTDNAFVVRERHRLKKLVDQIDFSFGAFGPQSSYWLDKPKSEWTQQAIAESRRKRDALSQYTTNRH